ncbi:galactokinase [Flagellimonas sp. MMG031]|uniref:Galactokinase n=1 Tax=Flagellimonas sp. MMG031 TaxID=3158549 RepID=A0AAU7MZC1_9FLAO
MTWDLSIASPGRINLIGEHTDYNDGFVLPAAIDKHLFLKLKKNGTKNRCTIKSEGFENTYVADLYDLKHGTEGWHDYVLGVLKELQALTQELKGFDCTMQTNVPIGSGMSSSAALECGLAYGLNELFGLGLEKWELIKLCQRAEHNFVGTQCGIMDQFASMMGKEGHSMLLDCRDLDYEYIPTNLDPYVILMLNTNVSHNLAASAYNTRREESASGLKLISEFFGVNNSFRSITKDMVEECSTMLGEIRYRRCSYVLEENQRVLDAAEALKRGDIIALGELLYKSHKGQREKYEVSCPELDFLVDFSKGERKILGSRMVGGGFGGCTLNIIHKSAVEEYLAIASSEYKRKFGIELSSFQTVPSQGTTIMKQDG